MGRKVFISYKYRDNQVESLEGIQDTRVRDYVDHFQSLLDESDEINKGEQDGEDLSDFQDSTIASSLRDKIYDSSITVVLVSKGMDDGSPIDDQWIPWEVSYSLKEHSRNGRTSQTNAVLAVVLPDETGSYSYYLVEDGCPQCHCRILKTEFLFKILRDNMFNIKEKEYSDCNNHLLGDKPLKGYSSYIHSVKWSDFQADIGKYLDVAVEINEKIDDYEIFKEVQ